MADPLNSLTGYQYDSRGRLQSISGEAGYQEQYQYNGLGQLTRFTDTLGRQTSYTYDDLARLSEILLPDPDGNPATANEPIIFGYDDASRLDIVRARTQVRPAAGWTAMGVVETPAISPRDFGTIVGTSAETLSRNS